MRMLKTMIKLQGFYSHNGRTVKLVRVECTRTRDRKSTTTFTLQTDKGKTYTIFNSDELKEIK
jgi:hypothetical protein